MICVAALTRTYGELLGHNGAGKTTLMKMLTGYLEPTSGSIEIDGLDISTHREAVQGRIGYLPENDPLYPEMTVIDYLDYSAALHGVTQAERIRDAIGKTELASKADDWIDKSILTLDEADVTGMELPGLALQRDGETLRFAGLNAREETNSGEARALLGRVVDLRITSVLGVDHDEGQDEPMLDLKVTRKGGEVLTYRFRKPKAGAYYLLKRSDLAPNFK